MAKRTSQRTGPPGLLFSLIIIAGATLLANVAGSMTLNWLGSVIYTSTNRELIRQIFSNGSPLVTILIYLLPSVLSIIYLLPIFHVILRRDYDSVSALARRRLLNMPLAAGSIGMIGWLIDAVDFAYLSNNNQTALPLDLIARYLLNDALTAILVFVLSYYLLEFISRKYFIPFFFSRAKLSACQGTITLSIRTRFYIYFFAVTFFPLLLLYSIVLSINAAFPLDQWLFPTTITVFAVLLLGGLLTFLLSRSYQLPLVSMERTAERVQEGDYQVRVEVVSNDEVGSLGEAINDMAAGLQEKEWIKDTFGKVVDPRVRDHLLSGHIALGGEIREVSILFTDIRGFTPTSAQMNPGQVVTWINKYFEQMSQCIVEEGGLVNRYIGDAILAVFGVPLFLDNHAEAATRAALRMRVARDVLNKELVQEGFPSILSGIGIHSGPVLAGNIGSSSRMEYTVIGDTVNVAARVEKLCKDLSHDLILSAAAVAQLGAHFQPWPLGTVDIRGRDEPLNVFGL